MHLSFPSRNRSSVYSDFFIILLTLLFQLVESQIIEYRSKQIFWLQARDSRTFRTTASMKNKSEGGINSEPELLIKACENIQTKIKSACSVIIYREIKDSLKVAQIELEGVKQRIGFSMFSSEIIIEDSSIDAEDKEFITQNFLEIGYRSDKSSLEHNSSLDLEKTANYPFKHYKINDLESILSQIGQTWNFDIWFIKETTGKSISVVGYFLFQKWKLIDFLAQSQKKTEDFFSKIESKYLENPYHNACHAADVLHSCLFFLMQSFLKSSLSKLEIVSCIIATLAHDIAHPGLTNRFLVNNRDKIAITYNDCSVLENMHTAKVFKILMAPETNILENLANEEWVYIRKLIVGMILETDMSRHFEILGKFRTRVSTLSNLDIENFEDKLQVLAMSVKCADIGHSAKYNDLHQKWSNFVCEEFFRQGDLEKERGQTVSMYCDRDSTDVPKSQAGFIRNICLPLFETWAFFLQSDVMEKVVLFNLRNNLEMWSSVKKRRVTVKEKGDRFEDCKRLRTTL